MVGAEARSEICVIIERVLLQNGARGQRLNVIVELAAKLRRVRFHDLRHTFASLLLAQGESLAYVKDQMRHSSINVTRRCLPI
jgi:integrase